MKGKLSRRILFVVTLMFLFPSLCSANIITTVDSYGNVGWFTSIAIGSDDLPVISYQDRAAGDLKVAKCNDAACTSATITAVDYTGNVGSDTSIAIGADGNPIISYLDASNYYLKVVKCGNESCTSGNIITTVAGAGVVPSLTKTSIAIGVDDLPIISYCHFTNYNLRVAKCNDAACTSATITTVDSSPGDQGWYSSIAIGADDLPIISHGKSGLQIAKCGNESCTSGNTLTTGSWNKCVGYIDSHRPGWLTDHLLL